MSPMCKSIFYSQRVDTCNYKEEINFYGSSYFSIKKKTPIKIKDFHGAEPTEKYCWWARTLYPSKYNTCI